MKRDIGVIAFGIASALGYGLIARLASAAGFPLDDAWIHQVYARNLGWYGQWAFVPGQPSAGSTSPLWTGLLAIGYALRLDYVFWTTALNAILLGGLAWLAYKLSGRWWVGVLVGLEWHLAWAAASGMETVLFCLFVLGAWLLTSRAQDLASSPTWTCFFGGILIGLAVWTRPDGLTLLPFCGWRVGSPGGRSGLGSGLKRLGIWLGGAALALIPYFLFNLALSGQWWPNTFFAKQAEYASLQSLPLWQRAGGVFSAPFVGGLALLLPGVLVEALARRHWDLLAWVGVFLLAYALRLPVTYQHGRYLIPVVPVLVAVGGAGLGTWAQLDAARLGRRVISRAWVLGVGVVTAAFWVLGARALVADIRVIESEMVATAKWVAAQVPPGRVVAAHDIGALGYFARVQLIDLAGLVSPDVIPLMGDERQLWAFIRAHHAEYVITYPGWCPAFTRDPALTPVFQTGPLCDPARPNLHMTVYHRR